MFKSNKSDKNKGRETKFTMESEVGSKPAGDPAQCGWMGYRVADGASEQVVMVSESLVFKSDKSDEKQGGFATR